MNWTELSEINFGLCVDKRVPATMYKPEYFTAPYDQGIEILQQKGATVEDVAKVVSSAYISDAHNAVKKFNGIGEYANFDWAKALIQAQRNYEMSKRLSKTSKRLAENEEVDILPLYGELGNIISSESSGLKLSSTVDYKTYKPFMKIGDDAIDKIIGGIPSDGPIVVYGVTGVGKSHWAINKINQFLHMYPDKTAAIYTLEMPAQHYLARSIRMYPTLVEVLDRLHISSSVSNVEEMVAEITVSQVNFLAIDDMDNLVKEQSASEYERVYRKVKEICRFLGIPVIVLCQPNREAKHAIDRGEKFLGRYDVAWSGAAENSAALLVALQRVSSSLDMESQTFETSDDEELFYEIFWKSRDGWPANYPEIFGNTGQEGPGAIIRTRGKQAWCGSLYGDRYKLWQPNSSGKRIGKRKKSEE